MSLDKKTSTDIVSGGNKTPLVIFKTKEDRNETDISKMSNFFEDYVHEMTLSIREVQECYNFMHIEFKLQNGNPLSVIGVRMLSPMNAKKQTPSLKEYISKLTTPFLCVGDYNIKKSRMGT